MRAAPVPLFPVYPPTLGKSGKEEFTLVKALGDPLQEPTLISDFNCVPRMLETWLGSL